MGKKWRKVLATVFWNSVARRGESLASDERIDYLFARKYSKIKPTSSRILFTGQDYIRFSDHLGYLLEFEPG